MPYPQTHLPTPAERKNGQTVGNQRTEKLLSEEEFWEWLASTTQEGRELHLYLDEILDEVYAHHAPFYSPAGHRQLNGLLDQLHEARTEVRALEQAIEQLLLAFSKTERMQTVDAHNAEAELDNLRRTYDRAYDLCLYKLDRIGDGWVMATNLLISFTILVVTVLFWREFW